MGSGTSTNRTNVQITVREQGTQTESVDEDLVPVTSEVSIETLHLQDHSSQKKLTIIHFNDVYNIEPRDKDPVGGAARFKTAIDEFLNDKPLVLFSGDALAPSNMSVVTLGKQMVPVLNSLHIQAAVYGNHDFDFGVEHLVDIANETNFPWLMTNVLNKYTNRPLAEGEKYLILEWENVKIGLLGLVEEEWLATLATLTMDDVIYTDYVESAKHHIPILKEQGCELIIALTHMRLPNDKRLAENVPSIDIILGGHDHHYEICNVNGIHILKSGSDFRDFSQLTVVLEGDRPQVSIEQHTITRNIQEDEEVRNIVEEYMQSVVEGLEEEIGTIKCSLDGRFKSVRTQETNLGNLVTDIMCVSTRSDCALLNSGTLRSDTIHESGAFKLKDLMAILPMVDPLVVLEITGKQLLDALENGVSQYPKLEGRFPQVSGLIFTFDSTQQSGERVLSDTVKIKGEPLDYEKKYKLCTKSYLADGKDGYDVFKNLPVLVNIEEGPILTTIVRNYFIAQNHLNGGFGSVTSIQSAIAALAANSTDGINPQVEGRIIST